ncbi:MAG: hypothetical protein QM820_06935 [Minicystis sp.]
MTPQKSMAFDRVGPIFVLVHGTSPPSDEAWSAYLDALRQVDLSRARSLVFTQGGAPSGVQRARLQEIMGGRESLGAIVTESTWVRAVGKALSLANPSLQVFSPDDLAGACRHLKLSEAESAVVERKLAELRKTMGF